MNNNLYKIDMQDWNKKDSFCKTAWEVTPDAGYSLWQQK